MPVYPITINVLRRFAVARSLFAPVSVAAAIQRLGFVQAEPIRVMRVYGNEWSAYWLGLSFGAHRDAATSFFIRRWDGDAFAADRCSKTKEIIDNYLEILPGFSKIFLPKARSTNCNDLAIRFPP